MVTLETKGLMSGEGWDVLKETWSAGCQSLVAILIVKGSARRELIAGARSRAPETASEPDYKFLLAVDLCPKTCCVKVRTGGQKSSCMSTTSRAALRASIPEAPIVLYTTGTACRDCLNIRGTYMQSAEWCCGRKSDAERQVGPHIYSRRYSD